MARGRMLNQRIADDIEFNSMSIEAQFMFMRTIPHLDRDGLITGHPALLWSKVAPLLPQYVAQMKDIINEWIAAGFVIHYVDGKTPVLFFLNFSKNQVGLRYEREPESEYNPPPGYIRTERGLVEVDEQPAPQSNGVPPQTSGNVPADFRQPSGNHPPEYKRIEKNKTTTAHAREAVAEENGGGGSGGELPPTPQTNADYAQIATTFENNGFGMLTAILRDEISALMEEYPTPWILEAMRVAVTANKRQLRYVRGILVRWRADGIDPLVHTPPAVPPSKPVPEPVIIPAAARALAERARAAIAPQ